MMIPEISITQSEYNQLCKILDNFPMDYSTEDLVRLRDDIGILMSKMRKDSYNMGIKDASKVVLNLHRS